MGIINPFRLTQLLNPSLFSFNPLQISIRLWERNKYVRRFGYRPKFHCQGLLPRVKGDKGPLSTVPIEPKKDPWHPKKALYGQNDYIDILGDGKIHPSELPKNGPYWVNNFQGNEMQMCIRQRSAKSYWKWLKPKKYHELNKRIHYLYKFLNYRKKPPPPQYPWYNKKLY